MVLLGSNIEKELKEEKLVAVERGYFKSKCVINKFREAKKAYLTKKIIGFSD